MWVLRNLRVLLVVVGVTLLAGCASQEADPVVPATATGDDADARPYVGDEACADCHEDLYRSYHRTGMGRSVSRFDPTTAPERFDADVQVYDARSDLHYEPFVRGDTLFQREFRTDGSGQVVYERIHPVEWVIGSGNATRSYLMNVNGHVTQMPLTWYVDSARWDLSPGYEQINQRFSRPISHECMTCHNGLPGYSLFTQSHYTDVPEGITCERCHGPGGPHVERRLAGLGPPEGQPDPTIVNAAHLDRSLQLAICQQCHLTGITVFKQGDDVTSYRPGRPLAAHRTVFALEEERDDPERFGIASHAERLAQSACYEHSAMTCTTCHDPHRPVAELGADYFNEVCQGCHTPTRETREVMCSREETHGSAEATSGNCIGCHLQKSGTSDIPHVTFTDHWIRRTLPPARHPEDIQRILVRPEPFVLVRMTDDGATDEALASLEEAIAYFNLYDTQHRIPAYLPGVIQRVRQGLVAGADHPEARLALGRALAEMDSVAQALPVFRQALKRYPQHARLHYWLGNVLLRSELADSAMTYLERAVEIQPDFTEARFKLAEVHEALGDLIRARQVYEEVLEQDPVHHPAAWNNLGFLFLQQNRLQEADSLFERALALEPDLVVALVNRGAVRLLHQDFDTAISLFERAVRLDPTNVAALGNLGLVYAQRGRYAEAQEMLLRVLRLDPDDQRARSALDQVNQLLNGSS